MSLSLYDPPRNEQKLLSNAVKEGLFPKQTANKLRKFLAAKKAAEDNLAVNDLMRSRIEKQQRYNTFLELQRLQSMVETGRIPGLRDANLDARTRELKYQMSGQSDTPAMGQTVANGLLGQRQRASTTPLEPPKAAAAVPMQKSPAPPPPKPSGRVTTPQPPPAKAPAPAKAQRIPQTPPLPATTSEGLLIRRQRAPTSPPKAQSSSSSSKAPPPS